MALKTRIGTITLRFPQTFRETGQTACNFDDTRCEKQTVTLYRDERGGQDRVTWTLSGKCVKSLIVNRLFNATDAKVDTHVGDAQLVHKGDYTYRLHHLLTDSLYSVKLDEGVSVDIEQHVSEYNGYVSHFSRITIDSPTNTNKWGTEVDADGVPLSDDVWHDHA